MIILPANRAAMPWDSGTDGNAMTVQIDQIFTATAENIWAFLSVAGQGCYIPAYQRAYAWDSDNVDRLVEDAINGLNHLTTRPAAISFLGTIIAIHDVNHVTVNPVFKAEVAPRVMTIIDGQQRISTSVMINIALHAHISALMARIGTAEGEEFDWVRWQANDALAELWDTFVLDRNNGVPEIYRYYPRVIRAMNDVWSKRQVQAKYTTPVARLIWDYIKHVKSDVTPKPAFDHRVERDDGTPDTTHGSIIRVFDYIRKELAKFTSRQSDKYEFPNLQQAVSNDGFMTALWSYPAADPVKKYITESSDHRLFAHVSSLLRALIFYKYFCTRMALTIVTTRTEDDAFDMFEALNTTGEPLTAYETFRPKVIEAETLVAFEDSVSHKGIQRIDKYLETFKKAEERQRATAELLIPYALSETGEKLQKNLSDQRRYLRDSFNDLPTLDEKRSAVTSMANLAAFMETGWQMSPEEAPVLEGAKEFDAITGFCFQALRSLKHTITISALARFYDELRRAPTEDRAAKMKDFFDAIQATTAFSMLWRGGKGGTESIDGLYRSVMREGDSVASIPPIAKRVGAVRGVVSLNNYRRLLKKRLLDEFPTKDAWVQAASQIGIYAHSAPVAKFLVICASHDTVVDTTTGNEGLIKRGRAGVAPTMTADFWRAEASFSVEHIAPQSRTLEWDDTIYRPGTEHAHRLGNLTMLPRDANTYVSNRNWKHKQLLYRYFASETDEAATAVSDLFAPAGLVVSVAGGMILGTASYMPMCKAVGSYPGDWDLAAIDKRSKRIAELAYDNLIGWLG